MTSGQPRSRMLDPGDAAATPPVAALPDRACNGVDIAVFFPVDNTGIKAARDICKTCPHRQPCLDWAIDTRQAFGIYGATTPDERGTAPEDDMSDHAYSVGDWVAITARVVELHPNDIDLGVQLFSKTDQYKALFVRWDLCEPADKPLNPEPGVRSVVLLNGRTAYQRVDHIWVAATGRNRLLWASLNDLGHVEVIHHA